MINYQFLNNKEKSEAVMILINAPHRIKDAVTAIRRSLLTGDATVQCHTIEVYLFYNDCNVI